jgi:stearoyl-CoA desaturase (delta-9 desaturase)
MLVWLCMLCCRVSSHRYHHMHCDTPLDPHSPYEGFWWSHMGWLLDNKVGRAGSRVSSIRS